MAQILAVGISNGLFWFTPLVPALSLPPHVLLQEARLQVLLPYIHERPDQLALFVTWKLPKCYLPESAKRTVRKKTVITPPLPLPSSKMYISYNLRWLRLRFQKLPKSPFVFVSSSLTSCKFLRSKFHRFTMPPTVQLLDVVWLEPG